MHCTVCLFFNGRPGVANWSCIPDKRASHKLGCSSRPHSCTCNKRTVQIDRLFWNILFMYCTVIFKIAWEKHTLKSMVPLPSLSKIRNIWSTKTFALPTGRIIEYISSILSLPSSPSGQSTWNIKGPFKKVHKNEQQFYDDLEISYKTNT